MGSQRISFADFSRRLVLSAGREQIPPGAVRRASGIAPEITASALSRWGSSSLYPGIAAIQLYYWNGTRYAYNGSALYANGTSVKTGFNGQRLTFNSGPPQPGLPDYLFVLGGGVAPFKIDPSGAITNWGILPPPNGANATNIAAEQIVIDTFNASATNWTAYQCVIADEVSEFQTGTGSLFVNPTAGPWRIHMAPSPTLNLGTYSGGDISLETDVVQFWVYFHGTFNTTWMEIDFDVNDGSFKKDWYSYSFGLISPQGVLQGDVPARGTQVMLNFQQDEWQQLTIPKSAFQRNGVDYQYDWANVVSIRFQGGNFASYLLLDNLTLSGGCAMGAGPAVGNGGSEYDYYVVYRNLTTGSQSNPQSNAATVPGVQVNKVRLSNIPVSADSQVSARDLYRTQALTQPGGGIPFYLDTIYDNTTTTYTDKVADSSVRLATTVWMPSVALPPNTSAPYYVDGGNGYYFKLTTNGTTGSVAPDWVVPSTNWSPNTIFYVNETIGPRKGAGNFFKLTIQGISGLTEPNWAAFLTVGDAVADGTAIWTNEGLKTTTDNTTVWTFEGINSTAILGNEAALLDNAPPLITYNDAVISMGSMWWDRDSAVGAERNVYVSPPGRFESVGATLQITSQNDPTQKLINWDSALWLFSQERAFQIWGTYPQFTSDPANEAVGTNTPFAIVGVQLLGIIYWAPDGIRVMNWSGSRLIGFEQLAPILRGQPEENVAAWSPTSGPIWAALSRDEVIFSDGSALTLGLTYDGGGMTWRLPGQILTALWYERQTGEIQAAWGGNIYLFEQPGQLTDNSTAIPFEFQSAATMPDTGAEFTTQRIYITVNPNVSGVAQTLTPSLIIDGVSTALPTITASKRTTFELSPKLFGRFFDGINLTGSLTGRVEIFRLEADVWLGLQEPPA